MPTFKNIERPATFKMNNAELADLVAEYESSDASDAEKERPVAESLTEAIRIAACSIDRRGKRHSHQRKIRRGVLPELNARLQDRISEIEAAGDFREIYAIVQSETTPLYGAGALLTYDVALRIGLYLRKLPREVYLHAAPLDVARRLGIKGVVVPVTGFPEPLRRLQPMQIEDFLCLFHKRIR